MKEHMLCGELSKEATIRNFRIVQMEGNEKMKKMKKILGIVFVIVLVVTIVHVTGKTCKRDEQENNAISISHVISFSPSTSDNYREYLNDRFNEDILQLLNDEDVCVRVEMLEDYTIKHVEVISENHVYSEEEKVNISRYIETFNGNNNVEIRYVKE